MRCATPRDKGSRAPCLAAAAVYSAVCPALGPFHRTTQSDLAVVAPRSSSHPLPTRLRGRPRWVDNGLLSTVSKVSFWGSVFLKIVIYVKKNYPPTETKFSIGLLSPPRYNISTYIYIYICIYVHIGVKTIGHHEPIYTEIVPMKSSLSTLDHDSGEK